MAFIDLEIDAADKAGWTAIVLAGERPGGDPLAQELGVPAKALIEIEGRTMLSRVVGAILESNCVSKVIVLAQQTELILQNEPSNLFSDPRVALMTSGDGIASSLRSILGAADAPWPVLVTTADNALLTPARVQSFLANAGDCDIGIGVSERSVVESEFPSTRRTWLKFRDGHYSGANLFAFRSDKCLPAIDHWREVEQDRKKGIKLIASFGPSLLMTFLLRRVAFEKGLGMASRKMGLVAKPVVLDAEAPIDVDKPEDLVLVQQILAKRSEQQKSASPAIIESPSAASQKERDQSAQAA